MEVTNTFGPIDIATSGMRAQKQLMEVISSNVANARTTDAGKGEPYRRLEAILKTDEEGISGVSMDRIVPDRSDFYKIFDPGNPDADDQGYVAMPNVNLPTEMINLTIATRTYQANAAILRRYQQMVETTFELLR
ncbi:MAG TPA: flagellar basal body rod protein FlgC [Sedimentisphaerales bacterium]|nr:flagellar basal body rod protein FlgC [Sedimentisphaerales bacterium]